MMIAVWPIALVVLLVLILGLVALCSGLKGSSPVTWVLAGAVLLLLAAGAAVLFVMPASLALQIEGTPGTPFAGEIVVDGKVHALRGVTPQSFEYQGRRAEYVVIRTDFGQPGQLQVRVPGGTCTDDRGVKGGIHRQPPFGGGAWQGGMGEQEWQEAAARLLPQDAAPQTSPVP